MNRAQQAMPGLFRAALLMAVVAVAACGDSEPSGAGDAAGSATDGGAVGASGDAGGRAGADDASAGSSTDGAGVPAADTAGTVQDTGGGPTGPDPEDPVEDPLEVDTDGDGIPDVADLDPADSDFPGTALENTVYAHTSGELFYLGIKTYTLHSVANFGWPADGGGHQMTDIAIDGYGQLFGVTYERLYTCHPGTAVCTTLALLPGQFNGLTMVPRGVLDEERDVLIGVTTGGAWVRLDISGSQVTASTLGEYGNGFSSSGDTFSIFGVGTFAAADKVGSSDDHIVILDPATGAVVGVVGPLAGYSDIFGLAGWTERAFAFDEGGDVLVVDILDGETTVIIESEHAWWGAGVRTRIPLE